MAIIKAKPTSPGRRFRVQIKEDLVYVKSIIAHAAGTGIATATGQVYFVPNGSTAGATNKIFDVDINSGETVLLEPSYPLVLDTTGDALFVGTGNFTGIAATHVNFIITGDKEA